MNHLFTYLRTSPKFSLPVLPQYKCEKGLYKKVMRDAIASSEVKPQFGGYEYGEKIVEEIDLYEATKADSSLKHFIDDLSSTITRITIQEKVRLKRTN